MNLWQWTTLVTMMFQLMSGKIVQFHLYRMSHLCSLALESTAAEIIDRNRVNSLIFQDEPGAMEDCGILQTGPKKKRLVGLLCLTFHLRQFAEEKTGQSVKQIPI
jgi:hypothetical protein